MRSRILRIGQDLQDEWEAGFSGLGRIYRMVRSRILRIGRDLQDGEKGWQMFEDDKLTYQIIGCAMKVHNVLGCGFQEVIYQRCLAKELEIAGLSYEREKEMEIYYHDEMIGTRRIDFLVEGKVIVELKAQAKLDDVHLVQGKNYLKVFNCEVGLLINFGSTSLETKRLFK